MLGAGLCAISFDFAIAKRVVSGSWVAVFTGSYTGVASAFACGVDGVGLGIGLAAAAWSMR